MTSAGSKSGVNCILENSPLTASERVLIAKVFASPGTPSSRMCPFPRSPMSRRSTMYSCPMMALLISSFKREK